MVGVIKRVFVWLFLTAIWGFTPGIFVYHVLGLTHHTRAVRLAWGVVVVVILGGVAAVRALHVMAQQANNSKARTRAVITMAISAALVLDVFIAWFWAEFSYSLHRSD